MGRDCCVPDCKYIGSESRKSSFPTDLELRKKWIDIIKSPLFVDKSADEIRRRYRVCSKHFENRFLNPNYTIGSTKPVVLRGAYPTLHLRPQFTLKKKENGGYIVSDKTCTVPDNPSVPSADTETNTDKETCNQSIIQEPIETNKSVIPSSVQSNENATSLTAPYAKVEINFTGGACTLSAVSCKTSTDVPPIKELDSLRISVEHMYSVNQNIFNQEFNSDIANTIINGESTISKSLPSRPIQNNSSLLNSREDRLSILSRCYLNHVKEQEAAVINNLRAQLKAKNKELQKMKRVLYRKNISIKRLKNYIKELKRAPFPALKNNEFVNDDTTTFINMQLRAQGKRPNGRRFTLEEKILSLEMFQKSGSEVYDSFRKIFPLPSKSTLKDMLNKMSLVDEMPVTSECGSFLSIADEVIVPMES